MNIQILGSGCKKCETLTSNVKEVAKTINLDCEIEKITDINKIVEMSVMITPAIIINGKKISEGKILSKEDILALLNTYKENL